MTRADVGLRPNPKSRRSVEVPPNRSQTRPRTKTEKISLFLQRTQEIWASIGLFILSFTVIYFLFTIRECEPLHLNNSDLIKNVTRIPAIVWFTTDVWWVSLNRKINCSHRSSHIQCEIFRPQTQPEDPEAYLFYASDMDRIPLPRGNAIWGLLHNESPISRYVFMYEDALRLFNYSSTFSRNSDLPIPLMNLRKGESITNPHYFVTTSKKNSFLSKYAPVMYLQTNCDTATERDDYVEKLMEYIQVDSYGTCLNNKELPLHRMYKTTSGDSVSYLYHLYGDELMKLMANYKFIVTIENAVCNDYITEKLWRAIEVGSVPIYYGAPQIRDWLPNNKSAILLEDFPTPELLSQHLHYLLQNDTAYEEYLEHKTLGVVTNKRLIRELITKPYENDLETIVKTFECLICEKIYDRTSKTVDIVTRKHYDCPLPTSALTFSVNPNSKWVKYLPVSREQLDQIYNEVNDANQTVRKSDTPWYG